MNQTIERTRHIIQGESAVSDDPNLVIATLLGSCVSACIFDPVRKIGGANHFLLPESKSGSSDIGYAAAAIEVLVNSLLRQGAKKNHLQAKLFGGGRISANLPHIGRANAEAAQKFLHNEDIPIVAHDLCGTRVRRLKFWPTTGRVRLLLLDPLVATPAEAPRAIQPNDIELF